MAVSYNWHAEPQEQLQVPSRQTSDSSSSGVGKIPHLCGRSFNVFCAAVADASYQSTIFSSEVVPGVEKTVAPDDGNNEDGSRGGKVWTLADSVQSEHNML